MPRLRHIAACGYPYFVTATTNHKTTFSNAHLADILLSCIYYGRKSGWYLLLSFVIMPDHLHMIIAPLSKNISQIMKGIKGYSARQINLHSQSKGSIWQRGFYDYVIDTEEKLITKIKYIQNNPVEAGLVLTSELYHYSSHYEENSTDLNNYLNGQEAGQECPAYP